ncbi:MAG TPA: crosslink repair DNA glycosylase YcaQ family protein [Dermatophilaceae bacterium]|nr:crosslink repair DNA glycosylase YcaQ family protein [Dermatophilaceae bacterium]
MPAAQVTAFRVGAQQPDRARVRWPTLGRPGAVLHRRDIAGAWRPRASGRRLTVRLDPWQASAAALTAAVAEKAERLAAFRGITLARVAACHR